MYQPDCVCTQGITGLRRLAADVVAAGKVFTPHTWGNGIGLLANAHLTAGTVDAPFLEFPFDPPEWTTARRDFPLTEHRRGRRRRLAAPRRPPRPRHHPRRTDARADAHLGARPTADPVRVRDAVRVRGAGTACTTYSTTLDGTSAVEQAEQAGEVGDHRRGLDVGVADEAVEVAAQRAHVLDATSARGTARRGTARRAGCRTR